MRRTDKTPRDFSSKVMAINEAYPKLLGLTYDFIGNLDADVSFKADYFAKLIERFDSNQKLGIGGGIICEETNGVFDEQRISKNSVAGAVQLFRRRCYEDIGGYKPLKNGGVDSLAEICARMNGWDVETFIELKVLHHRRVGNGATSLLSARFKDGIKFHQLGYHPIFQIIRLAYRLTDRPYLLGSAFQLVGYIYALFNKKEIKVPADVREYVRNEQMKRLFCALNGFLKSRR